MVARPLSFFAVALTLAALGAGCSHVPGVDQAPQQTFEGFKDQIALGHAQQALDYLDRPTLDYLQAAATRQPSTSEPEVDQLIRRALLKLSPGGIGPGFNLAAPLQRLLDLGMIRPSDLAGLTLGPVSIDSTGRTAHAEALWAGTPTTMQVIFQRDDSGAWKLDLLNLIPYATSGLTMDRTMNRETEDQQIDRLIRAVPNP